MPMESKIISWPRFAYGKARGKTAGATISLRTASRRRPPSTMAGSGDARADHTLELYAKHAAQQTRFALSCSLGKVRPDCRRWRVHRSVVGPRRRIIGTWHLVLVSSGPDPSITGPRLIAC